MISLDLFVDEPSGFGRVCQSIVALHKEANYHHECVHTRLIV